MKGEFPKELDFSAFQKKFFLFLLFLQLFSYSSFPQTMVTYPTAINIGSQRELLVDNSLIDRFQGKAELRLHHPIPQGIAILHDEPWEGNFCNYYSIFKDGSLYRMYYRAWQVNIENTIDPVHPIYYCYAESHDGINWEKPNLGLFEFNGSKQNNIILAGGDVGGFQLNLSDNASMFKDENPAASPDARYKAIVCSTKPKGLFAFKSSDGIHWLPMSKEPVITAGAFDSQNVAFWDSRNNEYRAYWRYFKSGTSDLTLTTGGIRAVRTAVSKDFIQWENQADLKYMDTLFKEQLYTNNIMPYYRAPQISVGFPTRYIDRHWSYSMRSLPELEGREIRSRKSQRYGTAITESLFMASSNGVNFKRWNEAFLRPGIERPGTWNYGDKYMAWGILETKSPLEGAPNELSLYATESAWSGTSDALRRYTLRLDGFVSVNAPMSGGGIITRPIHFQGKQLSINFSTSAAGSIRIEVQDLNGRPLKGFTLKDCPPIFGDAIDRTVTWDKGSDVSSIAGKDVRLYIEIKDGDLYSFHFHD